MSADNTLTIYAFPGLGTDERIFEHIDVPANFEVVPWIDPLPSHTMASYAKAMIEQVELKSPYAFLGVSFGGMLATELHHQLHPEFTVLVSSIRGRDEMPLWLKMQGKNPLLPILPTAAFKPPFGWVRRAIGVRRKQHVDLIKSFYQGRSANFFRHCIRMICQWNRVSNPRDGIIQIHGDKDVMFPLKNMIAVRHPLKGTHFLIISGAKHINRIITQLISEFNTEPSAPHVQK